MKDVNKVVPHIVEKYEFVNGHRFLAFQGKRIY